MDRDVEAIARICRHSSIGAWTTIPVPYTKLDARQFVEVAVPQSWDSGSPTWAVRESEAGEVVGMVALHGHRDGESGAEIGFWLSPTVRGRGLMTRAVNMVCDFAFAPTGMRLTRVEWRAFVGNHASAAVAARSGFRFEGTLRGGGLQRNIRRDQWIAGRLSTDSGEQASDWPRDVNPRMGVGHSA